MELKFPMIVQALKENHAGIGEDPVFKLFEKMANLRNFKELSMEVQMLQKNFWLLGKLHPITTIVQPLNQTRGVCPECSFSDIEGPYCDNGGEITMTGSCERWTAMTDTEKKLREYVLKLQNPMMVVDPAVIVPGEVVPVTSEQVDDLLKQMRGE